ncbi:MAG: hypothetical protein LBS57_06870 [Treponema sp.]|jgi:hypothetical protein|nr:hypothetical protein [Treponema sp.]
MICFLGFARPDCFAQNFGVILNQNLLFTDGEQSYGAVEYSGMAVPWFSAPLGDRAELYLSGGFGAWYDGEDWKPLPEIYRFEFICTPLPDLRLEIGRVSFRESLFRTAAGLFDGLAAELNLAGGRLSGGFFYTGLLYKKAANIYLSPEDKSDFGDTEVYFASKRFLAAVNWEKTSVFDSQGSLALGGLCQFDLNGGDGGIHSQYLEAVFALPLGAAFNTVYGAVLELAEPKGGPYAAFALSAEVQWILPTALSDMLTLTGRFSSGDWSDGAGAFIPVSAEAQGKVLRPMLSGIALVEAAWTARLHRALSVEASGAWYFRTDKTTYAASDMDAGSSSLSLGPELYGGLSWAPFSDVLLSFGAGVFLPGAGGVFQDDAKPQYRVELVAAVSF